MSEDVLLGYGDMFHHIRYIDQIFILIAQTTNWLKIDIPDYAGKYLHIWLCRLFISCRY